MAEATKLTQIEKKMDMSLEDLIKMNRKGKPAGAKPKAKAGVKAAPKTAVAKAGVAGKRQAIKLKKAAKGTGGTPVAGAKASGAKQGAAAGRGGIAKKRGIAVGGGLKQSVAQKILSKARTAKQLGKQPQKQQAGGMKQKAVTAAAAKQSPAKKQRQPVQFNGGGGGKVDLNMTLEQSMRQRQQAKKQRPQLQQQQQQATQLSRKQKLKLKKRQQQQQQAPPAPALSKAASRKAKRQQLQQRQQLHQTQRGGVQKRGGPPPQPQPRRQPPGYGYAQPPYSNSPDWRRGPPPQQHMRAPRARPPPRMAPPPQPHYYDDDGGYDYEDGYAAHATARTLAPRAGPRRAVPALGADPEVLEQRAAMAALRLQVLEDELRKAERRQHIHQLSQMNSGAKGAGGAKQPENQPAPAAAAPRAAAQVPRGGVMPRAVSHGGMGGRAAGRAAMDMEDDYGY